MITRSNGDRERNFSKRGHSTSSTTRKRSPAWVAMAARSSGWSLRFSVCRIPPRSGAAKYVSRWREWFHIKVATRSPLRSPRRDNASASARERRCTSRQVVRCTDLSGCRDTTSTSGKYRAARSSNAGTRSGPSIMVPRMDHLLFRESSAATKPKPRPRRKPEPASVRRPCALRPFLLGDGLVIVRRVEIGPVRAPRLLLDDPVHFAQLFRREPDGHHLAYPHHHVPGDDLHALRREGGGEPRFLEVGAELVERLRLIVAEEDGQHHAVVGGLRRALRGLAEEERRRGGEDRGSHRAITAPAPRAVKPSAG